MMHGWYHIPANSPLGARYGRTLGLLCAIILVPGGAIGVVL